MLSDDGFEEFPEFRSFRLVDVFESTEDLRVGVSGVAFCADAPDGFYADCDEDFLSALAGNSEDFCEAGDSDDEGSPRFVCSIFFHCCVL